jgi:hypothetical protein
MKGSRWCLSLESNNTWIKKYNTNDVSDLQVKYKQVSKSKVSFAKRGAFNKDHKGIEKQGVWKAVQQKGMAKKTKTYTWAHTWAIQTKGTGNAPLLTCLYWTLNTFPSYTFMKLPESLFATDC